MRSLVLAAAALAIAAPAQAGAPREISSDPMTVSGRLELPRAAFSSPYADRLQVGRVKVDPAFAARAKLDAPALERALAQAAQRSLGNFGYGAEDGPAGVTVDVELLPVTVAAEDGASVVTAKLRFTGADACLTRTAEGRFRVLGRQHSGGARRAFVIGSEVALALAGVMPGGAFPGEQMTFASTENKMLNAQRKVGADEGVAPGFDAASVAAFGGQRAVQLALADYLRRLAEPCPGVSEARVSQK